MVPSQTEKTQLAWIIQADTAISVCHNSIFRVDRYASNDLGSDGTQATHLDLGHAVSGRSATRTYKFPVISYIIWTTRDYAMDLAVQVHLNIPRRRRNTWSHVSLAIWSAT